MFTAEFAVKMTCERCVAAVRSALGGVSGVDAVDVDLPAQRVVVRGSAPPSQVYEAIASSGRSVVLRGQGSLSGENLGAAVAILEFPHASLGPPGRVLGLVRMVQLRSELSFVEATVNGLPQGKYQVAVHEYGDVTDGGSNTGNVYKRFGEVSIGSSGQGSLVTESNFDIKDIVARSACVTDDKGNPAVCGIIARSAGIFQNDKRVCACDGRLLWEPEKK